MPFGSRVCGRRNLHQLMGAYPSLGRVVPGPATGRPLPWPPDSAILFQMSRILDSGTAGTAVFDLGPLDGEKHPVDGETDQLSAVMTDGQQHRYLRTMKCDRCRMVGQL